jgi:hypothetical protein
VHLFIAIYPAMLVPIRACSCVHAKERICSAFLYICCTQMLIKGHCPHACTPAAPKQATTDKAHKLFSPRHPLPVTRSRPPRQRWQPSPGSVYCDDYNVGSGVEDGSGAFELAGVGATGAGGAEEGAAAVAGAGAGAGAAKLTLKLQSAKGVKLLAMRPKDPFSKMFDVFMNAAKKEVWEWMSVCEGGPGGKGGARHVSMLMCGSRLIEVQLHWFLRDTFFVAILLHECVDPCPLH